MIAHEWDSNNSSIVNNTKTTNLGIPEFAYFLLHQWFLVFWHISHSMMLPSPCFTIIWTCCFGWKRQLHLHFFHDCLKVRFYFSLLPTCSVLILLYEVKIKASSTYLIRFLNVFKQTTTCCQFFSSLSLASAPATVSHLFRFHPKVVLLG